MPLARTRLHLVTFVVALALSVLLTACGTDQGQEPRESEVPAKEQIGGPPKSHRRDWKPLQNHSYPESGADWQACCDWSPWPSDTKPLCRTTTTCGRARLTA